MGLTQKLGTLPLAILTDASNNVGIGGSPSGSYKLEVTGTAKVSGVTNITSATASTSTTTGALVVTGGFGIGGALFGTSAVFNHNDAPTIKVQRSGGTDTNTALEFTNASRSFFIGSNGTVMGLGGTSGSIAAQPLQITSTGAATFSSSVTSTQLKAESSLNGDPELATFTNSNAGTGTEATIYVRNSSSNNDGTFIQALGTAFTTTGGFVQDGGVIGTGTGLSGGLSLMVRANADMRFYTNGHTNERMRITSGGNVNINGSGFSDVKFYVKGSDATSSNFAALFVNGSASNLFNIRNDGAVQVFGSLSKGSGSFRIDHPLESMTETHQLVHSFIEGPRVDLIYRGKLTLVNGKAQANIDEMATMTKGTFEALCREVQCFTTNESGWDLVKGKVIGNIIYIESQNVNSTDEISWMVIGERKDKHILDTDWTDENGKVIVEPLKPIEPTTTNKPINQD